MDTNQELSRLPHVTNLKLVTWGEFQEIFELTWLRNYWPNEALRIFSLMIFFEDEDDDSLVSEVSESDRPSIRALFGKYGPFAAFAKGQWSAAKEGDRVKSITLPLSSLPHNFDGLTPEIVGATCYRTYLQAQQAFAIKATKELYPILQRNNLPQKDLLARRLSEMESLSF